MWLMDMKIDKYNKRGFLLAEETLKVILAVIAVGFLAYLLFSLYNANRNSKDLELAKESLSFFQQEIEAKNSQITIYNPNGWNIGSWPHSVTSGFIFKKTETQHPKACSNLGWDNCICICEENNKDSCDNSKTGVCINNKEKFEVEDGNVEIEKTPITLIINYENKEISKA